MFLMRYRLRTLLIVLMLAPPLLAAGWWAWSSGRVRWSNWAIVIDQSPRVAPFEWPHSGVTRNSPARHLP
jgi:hypothetical protein